MTYALRWSEKQHQFDIAKIDIALADGISGFLNPEVEDDYIVLALVPSAEEAHSVSLELAKKRGLVFNGVGWDDSEYEHYRR